MKRSQLLPAVLLGGLLVALLGQAAAILGEGVTASIETDPVASGGDAADDPAVWVHPTQPAFSTIIGTDKTSAGLAVYGLDGRKVQFVKLAGANNVDLRDNFIIGDERVTLVVASNPASNTLELFQIDADTRMLGPIAAQGNRSRAGTWGVCMYRSHQTERYYAFNVARRGQVEQWEITSMGNAVTLGLVRSFDLGSDAEGCVADDDTGALYVAEQEKGIWRFGAEPDAGTRGRLIDSTSPLSGHLRADVEGLAIYRAGMRAGYLIASSQGNDRYVVYDRFSNTYIGQFRIKSGQVDGVSNTDGIEVTSRALGAAFPKGLFVAQDGSNFNAYGLKQRQNFKLVPWEAIADSFEPGLEIHVALPKGR